MASTTTNTAMEWVLLPVLLVEFIGCNTLTWIYNKYTGSLPQKNINVLTVVHQYIIGITSSALTVQSGLAMWRLILSPINQVVVILLYEMFFVLMQMTFLLAAGMTFLKINLTTNFHLVHDEDPVVLGRGLFVLSLVITLPVYVGETLYYVITKGLPNDTGCWLAGLSTSNEEGQHQGSGINLSLILESIYFFIALALVVTEKVMTRRRWCSQVSAAVRAGEQHTDSMGYGVPNILYGLLVSLLALAFALIRNLPNVYGELVSDPATGVVIQNSIMSLGMMTFSVSSSLCTFIYIRLRQLVYMCGIPIHKQRSDGMERISWMSLDNHVA